MGEDEGEAGEAQEEQVKGVIREGGRTGRHECTKFQDEGKKMVAEGGRRRQVNR